MTAKRKETAKLHGWNNFNSTVVTKNKVTHMLISDGVYYVLLHFIVFKFTLRIRARFWQTVNLNSIESKQTNKFIVRDNTKWSLLEIAVSDNILTVSNKVEMYILIKL